MKIRMKDNDFDPFPVNFIVTMSQHHHSKYLVDICMMMIIVVVFNFRFFFESQTVDMVFEELN